MREINTIEDLIANLRLERDMARIELCTLKAERYEHSVLKEAEDCGWGYLKSQIALNKLAQLDEET